MRKHPPRGHERNDFGSGDFDPRLSFEIDSNLTERQTGAPTV